MAKEGTAQDNIDPDFLASTRKLQQAEDVSSKSGLDSDATSAEQAADGEASTFKNNITGKSGGKKKGLVKKAMPGGVVGIVLAVAIAAITGTTALMPFHLAANFLDKLNTRETGLRVRSRNIVNRMFNSKYEVSTKGSLFGAQKYGKIPNKFVLKLQEQGIDVVKSGNKVTHLKFDGKTIKAEDFGSYRGKNQAFNTALKRAQRTKFGSLYDSLSSSFLGKFTNRNKYKDWSSSSKSKESSEKFRKKVSADTSGELKTGDENVTTTTEKDADGNETKKASTTSGDTEDIPTGKGAKTTKDIGVKLKAKAAAAAQGGTAVCGVMNAITAASLIATGIEVGRTIVLATSFLEAVDKAKAGDGDASPLNEWNNLLTEQHTRLDTKEVTASEGEKAINDINSNASGDYNGDADYSYTRTTEKKSAMEAGGITWATGGGSPGRGTSISKFSTELSGGFIAAMLKTSRSSQAGCIAAQMGGAVLSAVLNFFPPGAGLVAKTITKTAAKIALGAAIGFAISLILPKLAEKIAKDYVTDAVGEDLGNALASGASSTFGGTAQSGGNAPSGAAQVAAYQLEVQETIAENAELERLEKSPFDATSKYTFLGNIMSKTMPYAAQASSISSVLTTIGGTFSRSLASLLPSAKALDSLDDKNNVGNCPALEESGLVGDMYCRPKYTSDMSTKKLLEEDIYDKLVGWGDIDRDTGEIINRNKFTDDDNPSLSAYITFCSNRSSAFGQNDISISGTMDVLDTGNVALDGAISATPVIGEIADIISGIGQATRLKWDTGEICGNTTQNSKIWNSRMKYYSQFVEDESALEILSDGEMKSSVSKYLGITSDNSEDGGGAEGKEYHGSGKYNQYSDDYLYATYGKSAADVESHLVSVEFDFGGKKGTTKVHEKVAAQFKSVVQDYLAKVANGTAPKYDIKQIGGYTWRLINHADGTSGPGRSTHSWGITVDINWDDNPQGSAHKTDMPPELIRSFNKYGFFWGGDWDGSTYDSMHFEYAPKSFEGGA
ncbi:MAG: M15 family metallopeptidase [Candidatus Nomurabacteria bacterium]|jgi:hypothetical protein|nr:M15 family metallopeptidase [Candidatus Nomurabacteria bacterium]